MNWVMIKHLMHKDWFLNRIPLAGYLVVGAIALVLLSVKNATAFYIGTVLLISIVVIIGIHLVFATVINERKNQTLPFIMSLPITYLEFSLAKIILNLSVFTISWGLLFVGTLLVITSVETIPNGLIPFTTIFMLQLFIIYLLVLAVALISESETVTVVVMSIANISISVLIFSTTSVAEIGRYMEHSVSVWNGTAITFISLELTVMTLLVGLMIFAQSRKTDFI
jgi:ABC-2 type transport system permease protein